MKTQSRAERARQLSHAELGRMCGRGHKRRAQCRCQRGPGSGGLGGLLALGVALAVLSCGDSSNESTGVCSPGDTRECLGPGACQGAQFCGADGAWGACDCGANGAGGGVPGGSGSDPSGGTDAGGDSTGGTDPGDGGSSQQAGTGGGGTETGGAGGSTPTAAVGVLGQSCSPAGALACAGNFQQQRLVCGDSGQWEENGTCAGDEVCDTQLGATAGTCQSQDPACLGQEPGVRLCIDNSVYECGPDNIRTILISTCSVPCEDGACPEAADPCPTGVDWVNCASDCDGGGDACTTSDEGCREGVVDLASRDTQVVRTPSASDACFCEGTYYFRIEVVSLFEDLRATVSPPWSMYLGAYTVLDLLSGVVSPDPCGAGPGRSCIVSPGLSREDYIREAYLVTEDPTAAPRNVLFEKVDETATCPEEGE
jgi:hypothetical protein